MHRDSSSYRATPSGQTQSGRVPELDGVRGVAILLVLFWHYVLNQVDPAGGVWLFVKRSLSFSWSGVDLFFVLSGFLLGGILLEHSDSPAYFKTFYVRRICRIFPLYYLVLVLFALAVALLNPGPRSLALQWLLSDPLPLWSYATFTQNFVMAERGDFGPHGLAVTWSLAIEEHCYLVLPWLIRLVPRENLRWVLLGLVMMAPVTRLFLFFFYANASFAGYVLMPSRGDSVFMGVLAVHLLRDSSLPQALRERRKLGYALFAVLLAGAIALGFVPPSLSWLVVSSIGFSWFALLYTCFILLVVTAQSEPLARLTRMRWLQQFGLISFAVYLFHQPVSGLLHGWFLNQTPRMTSTAGTLTTLAAFLCTLGLALLSWHLFEKRFIRLGHRFSYTPK